MKKTLAYILSWTPLAVALALSCCSPKEVASPDSRYTEAPPPKKPSPFVIEGKDEWGYGRALLRVRDLKTGECFILFFEASTGSSIAHIPNSKEP
jgi:hypothetical protein